MKIQYVLKDDLMTFPESTRFDTVHDFETVVTHADHLEAVKQARADALRWVLEQLDEVNAEYIEVCAQVRYWEDSAINGIADTDGTLTPLRKGNNWCPVIRLSDGSIIDWPNGVTANIHFKVCDAGEYWLLDKNYNRIAKWTGDYVPNKFLCHGKNGYGDYIIMLVDIDGKIECWKTPSIIADEWKNLPDSLRAIIEKELSK